MEEIISTESCESDNETEATDKKVADADYPVDFAQILEGKVSYLL
jgi:hypothetical protein